MIAAVPTPEVERRILVVGAPRSGTTLVQSLLAAHSRATSFTESHFFDRHFSLLPAGLGRRALLSRDPRPCVRRFLEENDGLPEVVPSASRLDRRLRGWRALRPLLPFRSRAAARDLLGVFDDLARSRERPVWIEKTPRHLRYLSWIESVVGKDPGLRFVHVIRRGEDVVASLREASRAWEVPYGLTACAERWNRDLRLSLSRISSPRDHFVFYEELTASPEPTVRSLVETLGLAWEPEILDRYARASEEIVTGEETWKEGVGRPIRPSAAAGRLTAGERRQVSRELREDLVDRLRRGLAGNGSPGVGEGGSE